LVGIGWSLVAVANDRPQVLMRRDTWDRGRILIVGLIGQRLSAPYVLAAMTRTQRHRATLWRDARTGKKRRTPAVRRTWRRSARWPGGMPDSTPVGRAIGGYTACDGRLIRRTALIRMQIGFRLPTGAKSLTATVEFQRPADGGRKNARRGIKWLRR